MTLRRRIINDAAKYSASNYIANILSVITGIVVRRILGPAAMGIFSELMLIYQYTKNHHFGVLDAMDREIPIFNGKKDYEKTKKIKNAGFTATLFTSFTVGLVLAVYSLFAQNTLDRELIFGMRLLAVLIVVQNILFLYVVVLRTHHQFSLLSKYTLLVSVLDISFKIFLVMKYGLYGLMCAFIFTAILGGIYLFMASKYRFSIDLSSLRKEAISLLRVGFPMLLSGFVFMTMTNADKFSIIMYMDKIQLGYYSIASMMFEFVFILPNLSYSILFPRFYEAFGSNNREISSLKYFFITPTLVFAYLYPILMGTVVLALPLFIHYILPKFEPGIGAAAILLMGTCCLSLINMACYTLIALNKQIRMVIISSVSAGIAMLLNYIFVKKMGLGLRAVACSMVIAYFFYSTTLIVYAFKQYTRKISEHLKLLNNIYLPLLWVVVVVMLLNIFLPLKYLMLSQDISCVGLKLTIFIIFTSPLFLRINKKARILDIFFKKNKTVLPVDTRNIDSL